MEALAAVALVGNVLQFVEFVGRLFKHTSQIYVSASGLAPGDLHVQDICRKFDSFSAQLQSVPSSSSAPPDLQDCAAACKKDCDELLAIMRVLAAKKGNSQRPWKSFSAALSYKMKAGDIQDLKSRIEDRQHLMSLMLSDILNERVRVMSNEISELQSTITGWTTRTDAWYHKLLDIQQSISQQINTLSQQIKTPDRPENTPQGAIESICSELRGLSIDTQECQKTMEILNSLDYEERPKRHSNISKAHRTTFAWGLRQDDPGESQGPSGSFRRWLSGKSNLFWVSGKPGSGKSTFMKFVADHKKTPKCLQQWAGHGELVLARHFFTIYGTAIQRSLEGLLRSLLHNILEGEPKLMQKLLPFRWARTSKQPPWTHSELESALRDVANAHLSVHMCFFIDGLDEYSGDYLEICQALKGLSESPFIKVCVSSRPWNVFEDAFGASRESKLYIHGLTQEDILNYTQARLEEHPRWGFVSSGPNAAQSQSLINEVVDKSMGVFLWVFLVTRLLREGLSNDDSFSDLRRRVSSYPDDLEQFFKHILGFVDLFYHEKMAGTLMTARDAEEPLATEMFMFHDHEYDDEDYALRDPADHERLDNNCREASISVSRRINGRCKGLLEWQDGTMVFLHRTVFDFLRTPEMARFLREKAKANFCSHLSLLRARLAWLKRTVFTQNALGKKEPDLMEDVPDFVQSLREAARYARLASGEGGNIEVATATLLDNAELGIAKMVRTGQIPGSDESTAVGAYRLLLLEGRIGDYVDSKLSMPGYLRNSYANKHRSPLCFALGMAPRPSSSASIGLEINPPLLQTLLDSGHDPNEVYGKDTFWIRFVEFYTRELGTLSRIDMLSIALESGILETLLRHGADPTAYVPLAGNYKVPFWFHLLLIAPHIHSHHRPMFERIWGLTLKPIPVLSQAKFLERVDGPLPDGKLWASHSLWSSTRRMTFMRGTLGPLKNDTFILRIFARVLKRVRDSREVYRQCWHWFARSLAVDSHEFGQKLSSIKQEQVNSRKRRLEGGGEGPSEATRPKGSRRRIA
ncbi:hypothetical protein NCS56_01155300 [Fusarium sp. Ph1]|nr:hypothetical protein NCS56_01155300 [Fusarium sp. Ph1]